MNRFPSGDDPIRAENRAARAAFGLLLSGANSGPAPFALDGFEGQGGPEGAERSGAMIGPFVLLEEIGEGGFGVVWRAEQTEPVRREVALKLIKPGMDSRGIIARFEAERRALALMNHPNIAAVLDAGTTPGGRLWFAMELVRGEPVTQHCDRRRLSIRERLELFIPVCQAVQHAHQKGVCHRDLKPSNILVAEADGVPVPKVIDFGIARVLGSSAPGGTVSFQRRNTLPGAVAGTPGYMSPEQAGGAPDADTRSDIYTLGVILYELLTGRTPLQMARIQGAAGPEEVLRLVRDAPSRRPSSCFAGPSDETAAPAAARGTGAHRLERALRGDLDWIVLKALEKDPERRYASAASLGADITRHLNSEPVTAGPPSAAYRLRKLVQRNRLACGASLLILGVVAGGVLVSLRQWREALRQEGIAIQALSLAEEARAAALTARDEANRQRRNAEELVSLLLFSEEEVMNALLKAGRSGTALNLKDRLSAYREGRGIKGDLKSLPPEELRRTADRAQSLLGQGQLAGAVITAMAAQRGAAAQLPGASGEKAADLMLTQARAHLLTGKALQDQTLWAETFSAFESARKLLVPLAAPESPHRERASLLLNEVITGLGNAHHMGRSLEEARPFYLEALEQSISEAARRPDDPLWRLHLADGHLHMAHVEARSAVRDFAAANRHLDAMLPPVNRALAEDPRNPAALRLAACLWGTRTDTAIRAYEAERPERRPPLAEATALILPMEREAVSLWRRIIRTEGATTSTQRELSVDLLRLSRILRRLAPPRNREALEAVSEGLALLAAMEQNSPLIPFEVRHRKSLLEAKAEIEGELRREEAAGGGR